MIIIGTQGPVYVAECYFVQFASGGEKAMRGPRPLARSGPLSTSGSHCITSTASQQAALVLVGLYGERVSMEDKSRRTR